MLRVGSQAPAFEAEAYVRGERQPRRIASRDYVGSWLVLFFYPRDFTFVCPTEIQSFAQLAPAFEEENAVVIGASTDSWHAHKAWYETDARLAAVNYPVIADTAHGVARAFEVLLEDGSAQRGTFIIDPEGVLRHALVNDDSVGRSVEETLRTLQALRTGALCPAAWTKGEATIDPVAASEPVASGRR